MKKILIVCLLGMGLLLPSTTITAKEFSVKKIIDVGIEGWVLFATSGTEDGPITSMVVKTVPAGVKVLSTDCNGYACSLNVSELPSGGYVVWVYTATTSYSKQFKKY